MSDTTVLGQDTDVILGREFLTWLWFVSDSTGGIFRMPDGSEFALFMEQRISVQGGEGEHAETATVSGPFSELREARLGLATGKKVTRCLIRMEQDAEMWRVALKAEDFCLNSLKTPKVDRKESVEGEELEADAILLEKIYLMDKALGFLDEVYRQFLLKRASPAAWKDEVARMKDWIHQEI